MSEPQQPSVPPPYGQPTPQPQAAPQLPSAQPYPPQQYPPQPYPPHQPAGAPQGLPSTAAPYPPSAQPLGSQQSAAPSYAAAGYPAYAPKPAASAQALGRTALIIALVTFGIGLLATFLFPILYSTVGYSYNLSYSLFNGVASFLTIAGSAAALILGLIAIRRPGSPVLAGIAIGLAASEIAGTVVSWISSLFYAFV